MSHEKFVEFEGKRLSLSAWARWAGVTLGAIKWRIRRGWPLRRVFFEGPSKGCLECDGKGHNSRSCPAARRES